MATKKQVKPGFNLSLPSGVTVESGESYSHNRRGTHVFAGAGLTKPNGDRAACKVTVKIGGLRNDLTQSGRAEVKAKTGAKNAEVK